MVPEQQSKGRQRPLCLVCIKSRAHSPGNHLSPMLLQTVQPEKYEIQETCLVVNNDICPTQATRSGHLDFLLWCYQVKLWFVDEKQEANYWEK